ncbi:hypothetical protein LEWO105114_09435 [Legionella worsleiensis]|nr:Uncharacterised protein [Legionella worsleiensis]
MQLKCKVLPYKQRVAIGHDAISVHALNTYAQILLKLISQLTLIFSS